MRGWQGLGSLLLGAVLLYLFWPFLVYFLLILFVFIGIWIFRLWRISKQSKKMWEESERDFEQNYNQEETPYTTRNGGNQGGDIIDVEYTERRVNDDGK